MSGGMNMKAVVFHGIGDIRLDDVAEPALGVLARLSHGAARMTTTYSKITIAGHPIHPMLVAFPITFYTSTFIAFVVYAMTNQAAWWNIALRLNLAGVLTALVAAIPGLVDWAKGIPKGTSAKDTGRKHMLLNVTSSTLFLVNLLVHRAVSTMPDPAGAVILTGLGLVAMGVAGFLGWKLVQTHHVGVDLNPEQQRLESRTAH